MLSLRLRTGVALRETCGTLIELLFFLEKRPAMRPSDRNKRNGPGQVTRNPPGLCARTATSISPRAKLSWTAAQSRNTQPQIQKSQVKMKTSLRPDHRALAEALRRRVLQGP